MALPPMKVVAGGNIEITFGDGESVVVPDNETNPLNVVDYAHPQFGLVMQVYGILKALGETDLVGLATDQNLRDQVEALL